MDQYQSDIFRALQKILKHPPTRILSGDERQLLWKFRSSLKMDKRALTKFLRCVDWSDAQVGTFTLSNSLLSSFVQVAHAHVYGDALFR